MKRALATTFVLSLLAGCLGDLVKPAGRDGGPDDDGGAGDGGSPDAATPGEWPDDLAVRITTLVDKINDNERPDLVLLNDPDTPEDRGVLVLFDRPGGFFDAPDAFLSTQTVHPLVATTGDFLGGAPIDIMVVGQRDTDDAPFVIGFENNGDGTFTRRLLQALPGRAITAGSVESPTPAFAARTYIRDSSAAPPGLVFGDSQDALYLSVPEDWSVVRAGDEVSLDAAVSSETMNVAVPIPSMQADRNDLLVLDNQGAAWLSNTGIVEGGYQLEQNLNALWDNNNRAVFVFDFDADDILDFMTLDQMKLDVGHVKWSSSLELDVRHLTPSPSFGDSFGDALFAADIDGVSGMDLLVLDNVAASTTFGIHVARNVEDDADDPIAIVPRSGSIDVIATYTGHPTRLVAGDFDGDGTVEVWAFDSSLGFKRCLVARVHGADELALDPCD